MEYYSSPDKITRQYFDSLLLKPRYIDSELPNTEMSLFGHTFSTPIMTAALSHLGSMGRRSADFIEHPAVDGMIVYAEAAAKSNALHWVGMGSDEELEAITATGAKTVKIVKPHADNKEVFRKIEHAMNAGCIAVGMDIDHAFNGNGGYDCIFGQEMRPKSCKEIASFVEAAHVPFIIKGVLNIEDALKCADAGCKAIVLSHHHGMMPYMVAPLMVIEEIQNALKERGHDMTLFVDCGIISGMDAYKCLALGAKAVSVGRHLMPFIKNGADAVSARIDEMTKELSSVMARTGVRSLESMDSSVIYKY